MCLILVFSQQFFALDLDKLKQNFKDFYLVEKVNDTDVKELLEIMNADFSFTDIDYNMHRKSNWKPRTHLKRLIILARAFEDKNSKYYKLNTLAKQIVGGLNYWTSNNFYSDNWWHSEIGIPQSLGPTLIICQSIIPDSTITKALKIMDKSKIYRTGQNKIWLSGNVFMRELIRGNQNKIITAANTIKSVVITSKPYEEGIQPDYSFHQHGPQPQFGNYGLHFAEDIIKWLFIFNTTEIAFSSEKVDLMRKLMFEGQQKVIYKGKYEILATGRQIFPEMVNGEKYRGPVAKYELYKKIERIFNIFDTIQNPIKAPLGYVHFRNSDYSLYRTNTFFSSVRMSSKRVIGAEAGNGENQMGYHLGDGTNLIYRRGDEYHEIYPVWNWRKLPGTTTVQDSTMSLTLTWDGYRNNSHFTGGLRNNNVGITAFKYRRDSLQANKSYFFVDNKIYALGSSISTNRNFNVVTTINQCYKKSAVFMYKKKNKITSVWHDSIAYLSLTKQNLKVKQSEQTGNWKKVLTWHTDSLISKPIFNLEIEHGTKPKDKKYAYVSVVGVSKKDIKTIKKNQLAKIIGHSKALHALSFNNGKTLAISAFKACEVKINNKQTLKIKSPCILSLNKLENGWSLNAVDATQQQALLSFEINGIYTITNATNLKTENNTTYFSIKTHDKAHEKGKTLSVILSTK
ncbi:chondroitin AC lyase [Jejuia pallidilutea]|uniref:Chondroitin AC lyase n=1 Tax=Jejuia pallidilutea TaxID=504487 RepID=A0A362X0S5_9FLAO|nr:polysaccharide lyase family 8 super-sandwich domain-containing protein [Jejuia pallidilutea]PQV49461.1 chondroitin AC lyase [Jejuia pallidilutea]